MNYTLTAGAQAWKAMCTGSDDSADEDGKRYFYFETYE